LAETQECTNLVNIIAESKEKLYRGVCYLVPEGGAESEKGGEVDLLEARWTQVKISDLKAGSKKYDDVIQDLFHDVLHDTYSKRPPRKPAGPQMKHKSKQKVPPGLVEVDEQGLPVEEPTPINTMAVSKATKEEEEH
jgi:hypothetical protein